ncbi:hypothetical protein Tco_0644671 [Tanacetum coccineum]
MRGTAMNQDVNTINDPLYIANSDHPDGHNSDQCFEKIGYPDWYKEKKNNKKSFRVTANISGEFDKGMNQDTPFDMEFENGINVGPNVELDWRMVSHPQTGPGRNTCPEA